MDRIIAVFHKGEPNEITIDLRENKVTDRNGKPVKVKETRNPDNMNKLESKVLTFLLAAVKNHDAGEVTIKQINEEFNKTGKPKNISNCTGYSDIKSKINSIVDCRANDLLIPENDRFKWNPNAPVSIVLETPLSMKNDLFSDPFEMQDYIKPDIYFGLRDTMFTDTRYPVHILSGEHGIGKTVLAKSVAAYLQKKRSYKVFYTVYNEDFEETICELGSSVVSKEVQFSDVLELLKQEVYNNGGRCVLVIDNYDSDRFRDELTQEHQPYLKYLNTGVMTLITTTADMAGAWKTKQTKIAGTDYLDPEKQLKLFIRSIPESKQDLYENQKEWILDFIDGSLKKNTYLIVLAARLLEYCTISDIASSIENGNRNGAIDLYPVRGGRNDMEEDTLYNHYRSLFKLSIDKMRDKKDVYKVLYNAAAMPVRGLAAPLFIECAFAETGEDNGCRTALKQLQNSYWITAQQSSSGETLYSLHPMVKQIVLKEIEFKQEYISHLLKKLGRKITMTATYSGDFPDYLDFSLSLYDLLATKKVAEGEDVTILRAGIISLYDIISFNTGIRNLKDETVKGLMKLDPSVRDVEDLRIFAMAMNHTGYALLHIDEDIEGRTDDRQNLDDAFMLLEKAESMIEKRLDEHERLPVLLQKIKGNKASYYGLTGQWQKKLDENIKSLETRKQMIGLKPKEKNSLCGISHAGIADAEYHLGKENLERGQIEQARTYFWDAYADCEKANGLLRLSDSKLELWITGIAGAEALYYYNRCIDSRSKNTKTNLNNVYDELVTLSEAWTYLNAMDKRNEKEITHCRKTASLLLDLAISLRCTFTDALAERLKQIAGWNRNPFESPSSTMDKYERYSRIRRDFNDWLSRKELVRLFEVYDISYNPRDSFEDKMRFFRGETFRSLWSLETGLAAGKIPDRELVSDEKDAIIPSENKERIFKAAEELGMIGIHESRIKKAQYILVPGETGTSNLKRCELASREYERMDRKPEVAVFASALPIREDKKSDTDSFAAEAETEFQAMCHDMAKTFGCSEKEEIRENAIKVCLKGGRKGNIYILSCGSSDSAADTATDDVFSMFFQQFEIEKESKIICCTEERHCAYLQAVALKYALQKDAEIDTIGFVSSEKVRVIDYLMEIRRTIQAILDFDDTFKDMRNG